MPPTSEIVWPWIVVPVLVIGLVLAMRRPAGPPPPPPRDLTADEKSKIRELMRAGRKIDAIKEFRAMTGCGLKDAKDCVEAMER
jgi:ribosomal protein L7/L12